MKSKKTRYGLVPDANEKEMMMMMTRHHSRGDEILVTYDSNNEYEIPRPTTLSRNCNREVAAPKKSTCCVKPRQRPLPKYREPSVRKSFQDGRLYTERRLDSSCSFYMNDINCIIKLLFSVCILLCTFCKCSAQATTCDFKGSGLDLEGKGKGIQPVYLSCPSGRVDWHYPRSALRIVLQHPSGGEFHGCVRASPEVEGARLFVEGHRSLVPLYAKDDGKPSERLRCFTSYRGRAALYLEAEPSSGFKDLRASFEYDLQPIPKGQIYDSMEECRPCSKSELVRLYCSADFAAKGSIISAEDDPRLQQTRLTLAASRVFQQTTPVFSSSKTDRRKDGVGKPFGGLDEEVLSNVIAGTDDGDHPRLFGHLYTPLECGARAGEGEFMVLGSVRLGQPVLRCAPRLEDWKKVVASARDHAHCVLES